MRQFVTPRAPEPAETPGIVKDYRRGAENAKRAGFAAVEIHGATGYPLDQFLQDGTTTRTDQYGGSIENRARLMFEVVDAAVSVWGADRVGLHLAPRADFNDMGDSDPAATFGYVAREAGRRGIAFLFVKEGLAEPRIALRLKRAFGGPLIANLGLTLEQGEALLQSGEADAISWGELFIANPDLPKRFAESAELNEPNPDTYYSPGPEGYTDYPSLAATAS
jgi:2,4-dienoyl-CoA reductase-like NADH-dependent reductase (Old Yellow Enzyme family)